MIPSGIVTLLTDFGTKDPFAGILHGVILCRAPAARVVDLSHGVAPQDIAEAAFWLEHAWRWFPEGTVHVAVVDPGVGTDRAALAVEWSGHAFLGPDNGLLGSIAHHHDAVVRAIDIDYLGLPPPSRTFHGRDVFAPVAAEIAAGRLRVEDVGPRASALRLDVPTVVSDAERVVGRVVSIDGFGNLITDIPASEVQRFGRGVVDLAEREIAVGDAYAEIPAGEPIALVSSFDTLEIALRDGDAASRFRVGRGQKVVLRPERPKSS